MSERNAGGDRLEPEERGVSSEALRGGGVRRALSAVCAIAIAALLAHDLSLLIAEPCLGVADNQNFTRVTKPAGIRHPRPVEPLGTYVRCQFRTVRSDLWSAPSSAALLAWCARGLRFLGSTEAGALDLRQMGILHLALLALIVLAGLAARMRVWLALLLLFVVSDPGFLLFFNSFYADGALIVALFGTVVWLERFGTLPDEVLRGRTRHFALRVAALGLLMLLGGGSKMLFVPLPAVVLLAWAPLLPGRFRVAPKRIVALTLLLAGLGGLVSWNFFYGPGPRFLKFNNFNAVYGGILAVATEPESVLSELGIPREFWSIERTDIWQAGIDLDHPVHGHLHGLSRVELLRLYLRDPPALRAALRSVADCLLLEETHPRGNFPRAEGDRVPTKRVYRERWGFAALSRTILASWPRGIALLLVAATSWIVVAALRRRWSGLRSAVLFLLLWIASQCALTVLGEGFVNLHQHLLGARLGLDLLIVLLAADVATSAAVRARARRVSAGSPAGSSSGAASTSASPRRARRPG